MNRLWNLTDYSIGRMQNMTGNQQDTGQVIEQHMSRSNDSGVDTEINVSVNYLNHMDPSSYSPTADIMARRLQHIHFEHSEGVRNVDWCVEDENKENICPVMQQSHSGRASTSLPPDFSRTNMENVLRIFSRSGQREMHNEQEMDGPTLPLVVEHRSSSSSSVTSDSALSRSPLNSPAFSPLSGFHPIHATPRNSPVRRRRTRTRMEEVEFVSVEDLPEVNPFGPNGTPPRTPSPQSFTEISDTSGSRNSNEVAINEQRKNERLIVVGAETAMSTSFVTPPSRPPLLPSAPKKEKVDKKSLKSIDSPSFFPETSVQVGLKQSRAVRLLLPRKHSFFSSPTDANVSPMVLRSAMKPRRSTRIKRMPNRYKCNFHCRADMRKKKRA